MIGGFVMDKQITVYANEMKLSFQELQEMKKEGIISFLNNGFLNDIEQNKNRWKPFLCDSWSARVKSEKLDEIEDYIAEREIRYALEYLIKVHGQTVAEFSEEELADILNNMLAFSSISQIKAGAPKRAIRILADDDKYLPRTIVLNEEALVQAQPCI